MSSAQPWHSDDFPWIEVATNGAFNRNQIVPASWEPPPKASDTFRSLYRFPEEFRVYVAENSDSVEGYVGEMVVERVVLDFDCEADRSRALADARTTIRYCTAHGIPPTAIDVWYSGNKGYGIALPAALFGDFPPAVDLPERLKRLAPKLAPDCPTLDRRLYQRNRLLRELNTVHGGSGRYKVRLTPHEAMTLDDVALTALASAPRDLPIAPLDEWSPIPGMVELWKQTAVEPYVPGSSVDIGSCPLTESQTEQIIAVIGRSWEHGQKHNVCLGFVGWLGRRGVPQQQVRAMVDVLSSDDRKPRDRLNIVESTFDRLNAGQTVGGWSMLKEYIPDSDLAALDAILPRQQATPIYHSPNGRHEPGGSHEPSNASATEPTIEPFPATDLGNAQRLINQHGDDLRYCHPWGKWLVWEDVRWRLDDTGEINRRAKQTVRAIYAEAEEATDLETRQAIAKHAVRSENESRIDAMMSLAESEPGVPVRPDDLDRDLWRLACLNGVIDLRTGELHPARRSDLITKLAPVRYDPSATCPTFLAFLNRIMADNTGLIEFLRRALGYSLTGLTVERILLILYGEGRNGKSTLLEVIRAVLGDYAKSTPTETLLATRNGSAIPNDIAALKGIRFATASEANENRRLDEAKVKLLTGGDTVTARFLHREWFDFQPQFTIWLATNFKPIIRGQDRAIWDRVRLVPFTVRIPDDEQDRHLRDKLIAEAPGILAWAVQGCLDWQAGGLTEPPEVQAATTDYRSEMDLFGTFISDCCVVHPNAKCTSKAIYTVYRRWSEENGEQPMTKKAMGLRLGDRGFAATQESGGNRARGWAGIGLLADELGGDQWAP